MSENRPTYDTRALVSIESQQPSAIIPGKSEWSLMREMAASLVPTGFLPESIKTPEQAVAIMLKGRELNVPPMYALSNIAIVKGKPTISAEMMLALIYRDHGKKAIRVKESTNTRCTVEYRLEGWNDVSSYTFSMEDAQKANLANSPTWKNYPAAMLRARCISAVARMAFPECIAGMYVPGELGDDVSVTDEGEVVSAEPAVDRATGEILPDASPRIRATAEVVDDEDTDADHTRALNHIHAAAREAGISHHVLHQWAIDAAAKNGVAIESMNDATTNWLDGMARWIKNNPDKAKVNAAKIEPLPREQVMDAALANATPADGDAE